MMTERNLSEAVCGICGVIGEVYLGDGNEKNCCSNSKVECTRVQIYLRVILFVWSGTCFKL